MLEGPDKMESVEGNGVLLCGHVSKQGAGISGSGLGQKNRSLLLLRSFLYKPTLGCDLTRMFYVSERRRRKRDAYEERKIYTSRPQSFVICSQSP